MIKSYKIVLIIQITLVFICGFAFRILQDNEELDLLSPVLLLLVGGLVLISLGISVIIQKIIISIINPGTKNTEVNENISQDKFWRNSFFVTLIYGILTFLFAVIAVVSNSNIGFPANNFIDRILISFAIIIVSSLVIGLLFRVKESVNEIAKLLGFLMVLIAVIVFLCCLFVATSSALTFKSYSGNSIVGFFEKLINEQDSTENKGAAAVSSVTKSDTVKENKESKEDDEYAEESTVIRKSTIANAWNYTLNDFYVNKSGLSYDFLGLRQYVRAVVDGQLYDDQYRVLNNLYAIRENSEHLHDVFESCKSVLYASVSTETYHNNHFDEVINKLLLAYDDIGTDRKKLNEIYEIMRYSASPVEVDGNISIYLPELEKYCSSETLKKINEKGFCKYQSDVVWFYSFWARRNKERNIDEVYKILYEIQQHYR